MPRTTSLSNSDCDSPALRRSTYLSLLSGWELSRGLPDILSGQIAVFSVSFFALSFLDFKLSRGEGVSFARSLLHPSMATCLLSGSGWSSVLRP